jgi:hypothetical protein
MADDIRLEVEDTLTKGVKKFIKKTGSVGKSGTLLYKSWGAVGLQLLNFIANGSPNNSRVPPIAKGILRGSGSVFIGSELLGVLPKVSGKGTPNRELSEKVGIVTVGYNTAYAARIHENLTPAGSFKLGLGSQQSGDVGGQFLTSHLESDGKLLMRIYGKLLKKGGL